MVRATKYSVTWKTQRQFFTYANAELYLRDWLNKNRGNRRVGITLRRFARMLGVSPGYVCQILSGNRPVPRSMIERLVLATGIVKNSAHMSIEEKERKLYFTLLVYLRTARFPDSLKTEVLRRFRAGRGV